MPNRCTRCGKIHPDDAKYLVSGCDNCGSKFFFYIKKELIELTNKEMKKLSKKDIKEIEKDIREIVPEVEGTVVLDLESIRIISPGKYIIDITNLLGQKPVIIKTGPGKYKLDFSVLLPKMNA